MENSTYGNVKNKNKKTKNITMEEIIINWIKLNVFSLHAETIQNKKKTIILNAKSDCKLCNIRLA